MPHHLAAYLATIALLAMLPGANNAAITQQTLTLGRRAGLRAVAGASTGILIWAGTAALGLSGVLLANPDAYLVLRVGGAVVLCCLGVHSLTGLGRSAQARSGGSSYAVGLLTSLGNPKTGVVAISLIPQFVTADGPVLVTSLALGVVWAAISGTWFCGYVVLVEKGRARMTRPAVQRAFQAATGVTLLGLGVAVAVGV